MKITFTNPPTIGDLSNQITVASMEVITVAFNLAPPTTGKMNVSITLRDSITGHQAHFVYEDDTATPAFWQQSGALICGCGCGHPWPLHIVQRLITDGKLPSGTLSV